MFFRNPPEGGRLRAGSAVAREEPVKPLQNILLLRRKTFLELGAFEEFLALGRAHPAHALKRLPNLAPFGRPQSTPLPGHLPHVLALIRRELRKNLLPLSELLLLLLWQLVPVLQVFPNLLPGLGREALKSLVVQENAILLFGRQVSKPLEKVGAARRFLQEPLPGAQPSGLAGLADRARAPSPALRKCGIPWEQQAGQHHGQNSHTTPAPRQRLRLCARIANPIFHCLIQPQGRCPRRFFRGVLLK